MEKSGLTLLEGSKSDTEGLVTQAQQTVQEFEDTRRDRAKAILAQTLPQNDLIKVLNEEIATLASAEAIEKATEAVQAKIKAVDAEGAEETRLQYLQRFWPSGGRNPRCGGKPEICRREGSAPSEPC